jgi:hypothetical protein
MGVTGEGGKGEGGAEGIRGCVEQRGGEGKGVGEGREGEGEGDKGRAG